MTQALGIDTAGCNGLANWEVAKAHGVKFAAARASISWGYQDKWFPNNWQGMKEQGIHRFAYHLIYPDQPFQSQVDNFLRVVGNDWDDAFPVLDLELNRGLTDRVAITQCTVLWLDGIAKHAPKPLVYSRKQWVDTYTLATSWRLDIDWWLAQYLYDRTQEMPSPPMMPAGVTNWLIHQNADHFPSWPGFTPDSLDLDIDRWNGDDAAVDRYFGTSPNPTPNPQYPSSDWAAWIEKRLDKLERL